MPIRVVLTNGKKNHDYIIMSCIFIPDYRIFSCIEVVRIIFKIESGQLKLTPYIDPMLDKCSDSVVQGRSIGSMCCFFWDAPF